MQRLILPVFALIYLLLALRLMAIFIPCSHFADNGGWATHSGGQPMRPLAYRVLVPGMTAVTYQIMPEWLRIGLRQDFIAFRGSNLGKQIIADSETKILKDSEGNQYTRSGICKFYNFDHQQAKKQFITDDRILYTGLKMIMAFAWLLGFIAMLYVFAHALFERQIYALLAPFLALLILPSFVSQYAYTYDFAELFFCTACLYLLLKQRFFLYLLCFAFATLNKETSIYLIPFFVLWFYGRIPMAKYVEWLIWQLLVFSCIKGGLYMYFIGTPGQDMGSFIYHNLALVDGLGPKKKLLLLFVSAGFFLGWKSKPLFLRFAAILIPINIVAYMVASFPGEYRSFYGSLPVAILLITHSVIYPLKISRIISAKYW